MILYRLRRLVVYAQNTVRLWVGDSPEGGREEQQDRREGGWRGNQRGIRSLRKEVNPNAFPLTDKQSIIMSCHIIYQYLQNHLLKGRHQL